MNHKHVLYYRIRKYIGAYMAVLGHIDCITFEGGIGEHNPDVISKAVSGLEELGIKYRTIKPHTPKENGKVERSHRKDQERFYYDKIFYSLEDLRNRAKYWIQEYNNFPMRPLGWLSPNEKLAEYMKV